MPLGLQRNNNADGGRTGTGWLDADDGWLVMDRNGNGLIDSGRELFGDNTLIGDGSRAADGIRALAALDDSGDGQVDSADVAYRQLQIWQDLNQDGVSQASELHALPQIGIHSLGVSGTATDQALGNLNHITALGSFTREDGSSGSMMDLDLIGSNYLTAYDDDSQMTGAARALPDMRGSGAVHSLRWAASQSPELKAVLERYARAPTHDSQRAQLDSLLLSWSASAGMASLVERAANAGLSVSYQFGNQPSPENGDLSSQARWLDLIVVLERFNGDEFINFQTGSGMLDIATEAGPNADGLIDARVIIPQSRLDLLQQSYDFLRESVYKGLVAQTRIKPYLEQITLNFEQGALSLDFSGLDERLLERATDDSEQASWDLMDLQRTVGEKLANAGWNMLSTLQRMLETETLSGAALNRLEQAGHLVRGGAGNDSIYLQSAALAQGLGGNDRLYGHAGGDRLATAKTPSSAAMATTPCGAAGARTAIAGTWEMVEI